MPKKNSRKTNPRKNLTLAAYERILEMMLRYDIVPGQRLVFVDLAEQLGVSRTPVNNALGMLANEGYLDFVPNQGYTVHKLTQQEMEHLYEVREILEVGTIGKAVLKKTPEKIERFKRKKEAYAKAINDGVHRGLFVLDIDFHAAVLEMVDNAVLVRRYRDICKRIFLRFRIEVLSVDRIREIIKEHDAFFGAICIGDEPLAKQLLREHNRKARENLFKTIFNDHRQHSKIV